MNFWWMALKDALQIARDRKALLTLIFMPILLIGILGAAFGNMLGEQDTPIDKFTIGVVNLDHGELGNILEKEVFKNELSDLITAKKIGESELKKQLEQQKITAGLILPDDFSKSILSGEKIEVKIISVPNAAIQSMIIKNIVKQFAQSASIQAVGMKMAAEGAAKQGMPLENPKTPQSGSFTTLKEVSIERDRSPVDSFQYYAAGMGVMFLLMTVVIGVGAMIEEKEQEVYRRLLVSSLTYSQYLAGKLLGLLLLSTIQLCMIIFGTSVLFGVDWGDSTIGIILVGFAFVFSASGLGILLGSLAKTEKSFSAASMLGTQLMAAVGGSMVPLYVFPDWVNGIVRIFPNALALQTFLDLMSGSGAGEVLSEVGILIAMGFVFLGIAWFRLANERRLSYA